MRAPAWSAGGEAKSARVFFSLKCSSSETPSRWQERSKPTCSRDALKRIACGLRRRPEADWKGAAGMNDCASQ